MPKVTTKKFPSELENKLGDLKKKYHVQDLDSLLEVITKNSHDLISDFARNFDYKSGFHCYLVTTLARVLEGLCEECYKVPADVSVCISDFNKITAKVFSNLILEDEHFKKMHKSSCCSVHAGTTDECLH